ncbi:amino acid ABC transporter permease, partial [Streptomyces sp. NPDC006356]
MSSETITGPTTQPVENSAEPKVVPTRHYGRWAAGIAVIVLVAQFAHGLATNPVWEWNV